PTAPGVQVARELGVPVIIGDAGRRDVLASASIRSCRTLMVLTADDSVNLQTALMGRSVRADVPVVLRLFDGEFAERIQPAFNLPVSPSASYLSAPTFAARMVGQVLDTIPIGRHVLLVSSLTVGAYSKAEGETLTTLRRPGEAWVVEVINARDQHLRG